MTTMQHFEFDERPTLAYATSACLVDAQVFPYFYVPYPDDAPVDQGPGKRSSFA